MIYLIRHGETVFNVQNRHQGWADSDLTQLGRHQARRAGLTLSPLAGSRETVIFTSPLGRAIATARMVAEALPTTEQLVIDDALKEIGMGSWERKTESEVHPDSTVMSLCSPDGESLDALAARLRRALARIAQHPAEFRVVVSHGVASRVIRAIWLKLDVGLARSMEQPQDAMYWLHDKGETRIPYVELCSRTDRE